MDEQEDETYWLLISAVLRLTLWGPVARLRRWIAAVVSLRSTRGAETQCQQLLMTEMDAGRLTDTVEEVHSLGQAVASFLVVDSHRGHRSLDIAATT
jgi:hypothetical protein